MRLNAIVISPDMRQTSDITQLPNYFQLGKTSKDSTLYALRDMVHMKKNQHLL